MAHQCVNLSGLSMENSRVMSCDLTRVCLCVADHYLLQIQPYNFNSKTKTEASKAEQTSTGKGEGEEGGAQRDASPQWYDVDVVKGTQCTVTGYSVKKEGPQDPQVEVNDWVWVWLQDWVRFFHDKRFSTSWVLFFFLFDEVWSSCRERCTSY